MLTTATRNAIDPSDTQQLTRQAGGLIAKNIWLPKGLYDALPYFYILSGILAFLATLYISAWFWVLPHYLLFAAACMHLGIVIYRRRCPQSDRTIGEG